MNYPVCRRSLVGEALVIQKRVGIIQTVMEERGLTLCEAALWLRLGRLNGIIHIESDVISVFIILRGR